MKTNYEKPEVTYVNFSTEEIMRTDKITLDNRMSLAWGINTSFIDSIIPD